MHILSADISIDLLLYAAFLFSSIFMMMEANWFSRKSDSLPFKDNEFKWSPPWEAK